MLISEASFTVFDVETTGLYPYSGDRICEIGAVRFSPADARRHKKFHFLVNPQRPISSAAFLVNGITDEMVQDEPTIENILPKFLNFIKGSVLVAYNAGFDLGFIEYALGTDKALLDEYQVVDALRLARRLFPEIGRYRLGNVADTLGIKVSGEHRALTDTVMTWKLFKKELKILEGEGVKSLEEIAIVKAKKTEIVRIVKDYRIKLIEEAIRDEKKLNITYRSSWSNQVSERLITPKEIQVGYDKNYVVAYCHLKNAERNFRVDCILDAKVSV